MGDFILHALAKGYIEHMKETICCIHVQKMYAYAYDVFNFEESDEYNYLGYWRCEPPAFSWVKLACYELVNNSDFPDYRATGYGGDFTIFSDKLY